MKGKLTLIPTPIDDDSPLCPVAKDLLLKAFENNEILLVEELKANRRRWIHHGLPRDAIEKFVLYNEHTRDDLKHDLINNLNKGKNVYLLSDCGLPAFCDPGQELVDLCHQNKITVSATPFANSIALAVALSGFPHQRFVFEGFITNKKELRQNEIKRISNSKDVSIVMDTPYRLKKLLEEFNEVLGNREIFVGIDLNHKTEELHRGRVLDILSSIKEFKREFILILGPK